MINTIEGVIVRMREIGDSTGPEDGVHQFNTVYLHTTEAIRDKLGDSFFKNPNFVEHLDVVFANRYFAAVDAATAGQPVDAAWRPLFDSRSDPGIRAIQFVVAGMNAHINQDLPLAVVNACETAGVSPSDDALARDYRAINEVLGENESETRLSLMDNHVREFGKPLEPLVHLIDSWSITQAREAAWVRFQVLWLLRVQPWLFDDSVAVFSKTVGMTSRHLLTPVLP
jgi:uncharacterized protein DUF5995